MKRFSFILVLSVILTGYLFSQSEENEIINTDTVIDIDSVIVAEPVNEQEGKEDFIKYDFYNDYLADLKKTSFINTDIADTLVINDCKSTGVVSAKFGSLIFLNVGFVTCDIPIDCKTNIVVNGLYGVGMGVDGGQYGVFSGFGLGLGFASKKTSNVIIRGNICPSLLYGNGKTSFIINIGTDVILWKVFSIGLDFMFCPLTTINVFPIPTIGLNVVY